MKSGAIVFQFPSLTETFVESQIRGLIGLGCDVRVFADSADPDTAGRVDDATPSARYYGLPLQTLRDSIGKWRSAFPRKAGSARGNAQQSGLFRYRLEARKLGRVPPLDVVHAHFGPNGSRAIGWRQLGVFDAPIVTSFYGYDASRAWSLSGYTSLFREGNLFRALSNHMKEALISLGCPAGRIRIHPLGVDIERFKPASPANHSHLEIISVARLVPKKGIEYGLEAVASLAQRGVRARYTIVGDGLLRGILERRCAQLGIGDHVRFAGALSNAAITERLRESDVLLAPSVTAPDGDTEGTPVSILEAAASGLPVVATRHAGIPEIVQDGESGFLASERNSAELADFLERCAESPSQRATMGAAGRTFVAENHDIRRLNARLLDIYEEIRA